MGSWPRYAVRCNSARNRGKGDLPHSGQMRGYHFRNDSRSRIDLQIPMRRKIMSVRSREPLIDGFSHESGTIGHYHIQSTSAVVILGTTSNQRDLPCFELSEFSPDG